MELGEKVRIRREQLGLSQEELAFKMGYKSRTSINKIETGRPVTQKIIVRLANALNVPIQYLMGIEEDEKIPTEEEGFLDGDTERMRSLIKRIRTCSPEELDRMEQILRIVQGE